MKARLRLRLEKLEAQLPRRQSITYYYGWFQGLPDNTVGERHVITVGQQPTRSANVVWVVWEERAGAAPAQASEGSTRVDLGPETTA